MGGAGSPSAGANEMSWITMGLHQDEGVPRTGLQPMRPQTARLYGPSGGGAGGGASRPGTARRQRPVSARPTLGQSASQMTGGRASAGRSTADAESPIAGSSISGQGRVPAPPSQLPAEHANYGSDSGRGGGGASSSSSRPMFPIYSSVRDEGARHQSSTAAGQGANRRSLQQGKNSSRPPSGVRQTDSFGQARVRRSGSFGHSPHFSYASTSAENQTTARSGIREVMTMSRQLDEAQRKVEALEEEKEMWKDRSESMGETLRNIEADADEREKEHQKLLFLIGMREGELARLHRQVDHMNEIRHLEGRDMYETRPGDLARPSSPYFNEIDEQAKNLSRELQAADRDLQERVSLSDKMLNIVSAVSKASKERNDAEMAVKAGMTDVAVQTPCDMGDFQALISTANDGTIDPAEAGEEAFMSHVSKVARSRPNQIGVPLPFRGIVKSTDAWLRHKEERMRNVTLSGFRNKIMSIYSAKIASDKDDDHFKHRRMKMGDFVHEWSIIQTGNTKQAELELLEIIESAKLFSSDTRVNLFSRLCGIITEMPEDWTLPLEAVNFILDIVFYLHEITQQEDKAANATDKSKLKPMTDVDLLKIKPYPIRDDINFFIHSEPTYKKGKVCRVIKHAMMTWCTFDFTEGDSLPSSEANRMMNVDQALEFAIRHWIDVHHKRRERLNAKLSMARIQAGGSLNSLFPFIDLVRNVDPNRSEHQIIHMFQNVSAESHSPEDVDHAAFIQAMQGLRLDRPPDMGSSKGQDGFAYVPQGSKQNRASRIPERLMVSESRSGSIASVRDLRSKGVEDATRVGRLPSNFSASRPRMSSIGSQGSFKGSMQDVASRPRLMSTGSQKSFKAVGDTVQASVTLSRTGSQNSSRGDRISEGQGLASPKE